MAITSQTTNVSYVHDGVAVDYIINFMYFSNDSIKVYKIDLSGISTELAVGSEWSLQTTAGGIALATGVKMPDTVRLVNAAVVPATHTIKIVRTTAATQTSQPTDKTVEVSLDKLTAQLQEIKEDVVQADAIDARVSAVELAVTGVDARLVTAEGEIDSIQLQQTTQDNAITSLQTTKATTADLAILEGRVIAAEGDINTVGTIASNAMAKANNNEAAIALINVDTVQITTNKNDIDALKPRVTALEAADVTLQNQITNHEGRITDLETNVLKATINGTMDIYNNITVPAVVTHEYPIGSGTRVPLAFDADAVSSVEIEFSIERRDDTTEQPSTGILYMIYRAGVWEIDYGYSYGWDSAVEFTVVTDGLTKVGTVYYTSSNFTGANYSGIIRYRARVIGKGV